MDKELIEEVLAHAKTVMSDVAFCEWKKKKVWLWRAIDGASRRPFGWEGHSWRFMLQKVNVCNLGGLNPSPLGEDFSIKKECKSTEKAHIVYLT